MPTTNLADLGVDPVLTNVSVMHALEADAFVHHRVFPIVPVDQEDGFFFVFNRADTLRVEAQRRRPGTRSARKAIGISREPLRLERYSLEMGLPDEFRASRDSPLADEEPIVRALGMDLFLRREIDFFSSFLNIGGASPWAVTDQTGVASGPTANQFIRWNAAGATPIANIKSWVRLVQLASGVKPNVLVMGPRAFDALAESAAVLSRLPDDATRDVTKAVIAALAGLDEVLVPEAIYNAAPEDAAGTGFTGTWCLDDDALLCYRTPSPALLEPSAGYVFSWSQFDEVRADVSAAGAAAIQRYRDEETESDIFRARAHYQHRIVTPSAGVRITGILG